MKTVEELVTDWINQEHTNLACLRAFLEDVQRDAFRAGAREAKAEFDKLLNGMAKPGTRRSSLIRFYKR